MCSPVQFKLRFTAQARLKLEWLAANDPAKLKKVRRCLGRLERNPRHPSLNSHKYRSMVGPHGGGVWESYVENRTPGAWRVWWQFAPERGEITIVDLDAHP